MSLPHKPHLLRIFLALTLVLSSLALIGVSPDAADATAPSDLFTWSDVSIGKNRRPTITIDGSVYPESAPDNTFETGVQFRINGRIDDRHPNRPNGWDATGPREGSTFHIHPGIALSDGDVIEASWVDADGVSHTASVVISSQFTVVVPDDDTSDVPDQDEPADPGDPTPDSGTPDTPSQSGATTDVGVRQASWSGVSAGDGQVPTVSIIGGLYPQSASDNSVETGVQFRINGRIDDRHPNRPNGWDATGPREDSTFHMHPAISLSVGDVLEASWIDPDGNSYRSTHVVSGSTAQAQEILNLIIGQDPDEETALDREDPVLWSNGLEVGDQEATWSAISAGQNRTPAISIGGAFYPKTALQEGFERGVQFLLNGQAYDESALRPDGWDSTGPLEGDEFSMRPGVTLEGGDVIEARWVTRTGHSLFSKTVVPLPPVPEPTPTAEPEPTPTGEPEPTPTAEPEPTPPRPVNVPASAAGPRGPTGQNWPSHTVAYETPATIYINNLSKLNDALRMAQSGDVIEVAPHVYNAGSLTITEGNANWPQNVLVRPRLGQRQSVVLNSSVTLNAPHVTIAGFHANRTITLFDKADRSAWARIVLGIDGFVRARNSAPGAFLDDAGVYEIVAPTSRLEGDRMNLTSIDGGGVRRFTISGVWLKGAYRPNGTSQHNDTLQVFKVNGGVGPEDLVIENSVFFASHSAAIALPWLRNTFTFRNSMTMNCGYMRDVPSSHECDGSLNLDIGVSPGVQVFISDSDLFGGVNLRQADFTTTMQNVRATSIKGPGESQVTDLGGNVIDSSVRDLYVEPSLPNLDAAWGN